MGAKIASLPGYGKEHRIGAQDNGMLEYLAKMY